MFKVFQITQNGESSNSLVLSEPSPEVTKTVKRRNRVLQSCIPCHEMRRKCDRKRPCTRCVDQGLGDGCVYQLEDPAYRNAGDEDEATRLRRRIVDLEKTVRVLMERPVARDTMDTDLREIKPLPKSLRSTRPTGEGDENRRKRLRFSPSVATGRPSTGPPPTLTVPAVPSHHPGTEAARPATSPYPYYSANMPPPQLSSISHASETYPSSHSAEEPPATRVLDLTKSQIVPHCGCAHSTIGRGEYQALQSRIGPLLSKLNNLPEHHIGHAATCSRLIGLTNVDRSLRAATQAPSASPPQFMYTVSDESFNQPNMEDSAPSIPPSTSYQVPMHPPHSPNSPPFTMLPLFLSTMAHAASYEHHQHQHHGHASPVGVLPSPTPRSYSNHALQQEFDIKPFYTPSAYGLVAAASSL